jgi:enoyl-CoA hydratase/carnithine racemase
MRDLFLAVSDDPNVKLVVVHGGKFFSAGNDLSALGGAMGDTKENLQKMAESVTFNL